jgi:hypothetical protein
VNQVQIKFVGGGVDVSSSTSQDVRDDVFLSLREQVELMLVGNGVDPSNVVWGDTRFHFQDCTIDDEEHNIHSIECFQLVSLANPNTTITMFINYDQQEGAYVAAMRDGVYLYQRCVGNVY